MANSLKQVQLQNSIFHSSEKSDFSTISFEKGYGNIVKAGVFLAGKDIESEVTVDLTIETYSSKSYQAVTDEIQNYVHSTVTEHLREAEIHNDYKSWWFWLFSTSGKDYEHYKDATTDSVTISNSKITNALENNFSENKEKYHVSGSFKIKSTSNVPTRAFLYIETLNIKTKDGSTTSVINQDSPVIAADENGNTQNVNIIDGKLNIVPLS